MILNGSHVIVLSFQFIAQSYWSIEQKIKQKRNKYKEKKNTAHKIIFFWHSSSITWVRLETKWKLSKEIWINFEFSIKKRERESQTILRQQISVAFNCVLVFWRHFTQKRAIVLESLHYDPEQYKELPTIRRNIKTNNNNHNHIPYWSAEKKIHTIFSHKNYQHRYKRSKWRTWQYLE